MNEYWAQINENENWTEGKLETQKYAKTVSLFSALSVTTSKPAKTWRVYHSDTKKKKKQKKKNNTMERYINRLYRHQSGAPLYHSKVRRCGCWLKILRQRPSPDLFHTWKSHDDNKKNFSLGVSIQFFGDHIDVFFFCPCPIATKFSPVIEVCQNAVFSKIDVTMTTKTKNFVIDKIRLINFFAI